MGIKPVYLVTTEFGHKIEVTSDHPFLCSEMGLRRFMWTTIDNGMSIGDEILVTDMFNNDYLEAYIEETQEYGDVFRVKIQNIEYSGEKEVYDITVIKNSNFFANGIVVHNCPYYEVNKAPVGLPCLVETNLLHFYTKQYFDEFEVDPTRTTEMRLVAELAEFDIYEMRATKLIAEKYPTLLQEVFMGFSADGSAIINEDIAKLWDLKERLKKNRMKILETLLATRKEKAKTLISAKTITESATLSSLKDKIDLLMNDIKKSSGKKFRGDGDIIDV